jgi:leucyl/phenylalanyl-tRNA--protein transferase
MPAIQRLGVGDGFFPPSDQALDYPNGLLAIGGDLGSQRLLAAYRRGIFPWYEPGQPIMWWTPDPRSVLFPADLHISRSLRKTLRQDAFALGVDRSFREVMARCGDDRAGQAGTWIGQDMLDAYCCLHQRGYAHSVEVRNSHGELVGGLYGVALGQVFFGESMFSRERDASKVALVALVDILKRGGFRLIDCQVESEHLNSLGARTISRLDFEAMLGQTITETTARGIWTLPWSCGELL